MVNLQSSEALRKPKYRTEIGSTPGGMAFAPVHARLHTFSIAQTGQETTSGASLLGLRERGYCA
jgi:hypothetical protein